MNIKKYQMKYLRIYRDHKNMTNRLNNSEQANIDKIVFSSNEQLENIKKLKEIYDVDVNVVADKDIKQGKSELEIIQTYDEYIEQVREKIDIK